MRRSTLISVLAVLPLVLTAGAQAFAFQGEGGAASVFAYVNESAARSLTKPKAPVRQSVCSGGCSRQRSLAPVQRTANLTAQARKLIDAANKFYQDGKFTEAAANFGKAAQLKPNYEAFIGQGEAQYQLKQPEEALKSYQQALKLNPKLDDAHYNIGVIQYEKKSYREALDSLKAAIDIPPANADEYYYYGLTLSELDRKDDAVAALREAIRIDSRYYDAYIQLGSLYYGMGKRGEAVEVLRQATHVKPEGVDAFLSLGDVLFSDNRYDDAIAAYREASRLRPESATAFNDLADTYYSLIRSREAVENYEKALILKPELRKDWGFAVRYGNSLRQVGKTNESIQWLRDALALDPKADTPLYLLGVAYLNSGQPDYSAAIEALNRAATLNPNRTDTFIMLTVGYINSTPRMPKEALQAARRAQQLAPKDPRALYTVGLALGIGQLFEPAFDVFEEVVHLNPSDAAARSQLCNVSMILERFEQGLPECQRAVELSGPDTRNISRLALANMYTTINRYNEAIAEANAVIKDDPKMPMAHMSLGYAYLNMKKWSEAISALKETIRLAPELAEAHHLLGLTYFGAGRKEDAMQEYAVLLNLNPNYAIQFKAEMDEDKDKKKNKKH